MFREELLNGCGCGLLNESKAWRRPSSYTSEKRNTRHVVDIILKVSRLFLASFGARGGGVGEASQARATDVGGAHGVLFEPAHVLAQGCKLDKQGKVCKGVKQCTDSRCVCCHSLGGEGGHSILFDCGLWLLHARGCT